MKNFVLFIFFFLIGLIGYFFWINNKNTVKIVPQKTQKITPEFSIAAPPKESVKGKVTDFTGEIEWESRTATAPAKINHLEIIQQGEELVTGSDGNVTVDFNDLGSMIISPKTEIDFIQTLPINFVFSQTKGSVEYERQGETPFSVRSLHLITQMDKGIMVFDVDPIEAVISISVKRGSASVAFNDINYISQVVKISEGEKYIYDDETRTGIIR